MKTILIHYNDAESDIEPANGSDFTLEELYALLDTDMVQVVPLPGDLIMIIDEEAKMKPGKVKQYNHRATVLLHRAGGMADDYILGDAIVGESDILK